MAIVNRTLDKSEQQQDLAFANGSMSLSNGETGVLAYVPFPCVLQAANFAAFSTEGSVNLLLTTSRFVVGQGFTTWFLGSTFVPPSYGTSGVLGSGVSLPVSGSTLLFLMPGDVLGYQVGGGATAAIFGFCGSFVVKPTQDSISWLNGLA